MIGAVTPAGMEYYNLRLVSEQKILDVGWFSAQLLGLVEKQEKFPPFSDDISRCKRVT